MKIKYSHGSIQIITETGISSITKIEELYLVQNQLKHYISKISNELTCHRIMAILDLLQSAKNQFIENLEFANVQENNCRSPYFV